jgi:hypothetical protein
MFKVANADFIADKLASELLPDQEFREAGVNSIEAIRRRQTDEPGLEGRVEYDVDWAMLRETGNWLISCADNGDGMTRAELEKYTTTLAVEGANRNQSLTGNQGMGLKISGPTRHKVGVLIRSIKNGERTMVQVGWDPESHQYDLIPLSDDGHTVVTIAESMFPQFILDSGSGTVVTFLGNSFDEAADNTVWPHGRPKNWLFKYLNQRFFSLSGDGIEVLARQPSGDLDTWPDSREDADKGKSFNLATVRGTATVWNRASDGVGPDLRSVVDVPGDPLSDIPPARIHWWVLPGGPGSDVSTRTAGGGSIAVLFQNELHDWRTSNSANPYFARMGILFGKNRICLVIEPLGTVASDFARAHVLVGGKPVFETDAWLLWAEQFRQQMPDPIRATMHEEQARLQDEDPDRAKRIQDRLKDVMSMLRPKKMKRNPAGLDRASNPSTSGPGNTGDAASGLVPGPGPSRKRKANRGLGGALTQVDDGGEPATEVFAILHLEPMWVTEAQAETMPIVNGGGRGMNDRAAALAGEDGISANILLLNLEFRGYQAILRAISEWANPEGDETKASLIQQVTQEWVEQKMVEAVNGLRQLENGSSWTPANFDDALSPAALTAAFMADRYHTLREVRRAMGPSRVSSLAAK